MLKIKILILLALATGAGWLVHHHYSAKTAVSSAQQAAAQAASTVADKLPINHCLGKTAKTLIVSISSQHFWACADDSTTYDSAVITGKLKNDDSTPLGTYHIFSKLTNQELKGCQPGDCWDDRVTYWLPYQQADGGTIGFHDASWRKASEFGNTLPASNKGSHGCVELPTAAAKWLYSWASIGTTVIVKT